MKKGEKSIVSTNKRAADEIIESSGKRPKQALGEGGENKIDNQSAVEDEQKKFGDGEGSTTETTSSSSSSCSSSSSYSSLFSDSSSSSSGWKREKNPLHPQTKEVPMKQLNQVQRDQNRIWAKEEEIT